MPEIYSGFRWIKKYPLRAFLGLAVASQLIASVINISYNRLQIVSHLTKEQHQVFLTTVAIYNLVTYPLALIIGVYFLRHLFQKNANNGTARQSALRVPQVVVLVISFGWLPGAVIFPVMIDQFAGPISKQIYWQFAGSFSLAWLISLTTSITVILYVLTRALYPKYWAGRSTQARQDLGACDRLSQYLTFVAALIPMAGILMALWVAPTEYSTADHQALKILLTVTVGFGLINLLLVQRITRSIQQNLTALRRPRPFEQ